MSKCCASIWELLKDKRVKVVFDSFEKARGHLEGKTIGIDAINQTVTAPGASWAVMRREFGKRVLALTLCGAKLVAFIDGEFTSPGAGKTKKAGERAMAAGVTLPPNTALPYYYRGQDWWSRDVLGEDDADGGYRGHRAALVVNCTDFGMPTAVINDGEAEGGLAWSARDLELGGVASPACVDGELVNDQDWTGYGGNEMMRFMEDYFERHNDQWIELYRREDILNKFELRSDDDVRAVLFLLGVNDLKPPVEAIIPADARCGKAKTACAAANRDNATPAAKKKWTAIKRKRRAAARAVLEFVQRLSDKAVRNGKDGALAVLRHLAARHENDIAYCTTFDYNRKVLKLLGKPGTEDRPTRARQLIRLQLEKYDEEMRNGGARAVCGELARPQRQRAERDRIRAAAAFPRGILDAATVEEAYQWASDQFGGGLLPPVGDADYENILEKFHYVREFYSSES